MPSFGMLCVLLVVSLQGKKKKKKKQIEESLESGNQNSQGPEEMKDGQTVTQV